MSLFIHPEIFDWQYFLHELNFLQAISTYQFNMGPVTSINNDDGGIQFFYHNLLFSFQHAMPSTLLPKPGLRMVHRYKNYTKTNFHIDTQFLLGNDHTTNSKCFLFCFIWVQSNGCLRHLTQGGLPGAAVSFLLRQGCPIGCTEWREIMRVSYRKLDKAVKGTACKDGARNKVRRWEAAVSGPGKTSLKCWAEVRNGTGLLLQGSLHTLCLQVFLGAERDFYKHQTNLET